MCLTQMSNSGLLNEAVKEREAILTHRDKLIEIYNELTRTVDSMTLVQYHSYRGLSDTIKRLSVLV